MAENILEAIDALLGQPFCSTDRSAAQELEKWQQELVAMRQRLLSVSDASERLAIEESCRQVMAQIESRLAASNTNLFRVSPQVEYATFELANTLSALTAANTLAAVKQSLNEILQDFRQELHRVLAEERSATLAMIKTEITRLFGSAGSEYDDQELRDWIDDRLATAEEEPIDIDSLLENLSDVSAEDIEQNNEDSIVNLTEEFIWDEETDRFLADLSVSSMTESLIKLEEELSSETTPELPSAGIALAKPDLNDETVDYLADLDSLLDDLFLEDETAKQDSLVAQLSFSPPLKNETITTIDVETIEDKLNDFADRVEISFTIPGTKKSPFAPTLPPLSLEDVNDSWFLGIDFGNTHIRTSLSNLTTGRVYNLGEISTDLVINDNFIRSYKPLLQLGLPYQSNNQWRPILQWSEDETIPLVSLLNGIKQLLQNCKRQAVHPDLTNIPLLLQHLSGVVFGYPEQWDDAYIFNLREIILNCGFCQRPEQVIAVPQIIAPLLDRLHNVGNITEITLFIDSGVNTTELLLVKPFEGKPLSHDNLFYQTIDQGGEHLSLMLIKELLLPQLANPPRPEALLSLADTIKVHIDREDIWLDEWQGHKLSIGRSAYINRVCQPFLQLLNRHVNGLLIRSGLFAENIKTVVRSGGTMQGTVLQEWLEQKFPQAKREKVPSNADGLAVAPRFYGLLDLSHQQYSDFFLVHEMCKLNWQEPMHPSTVLQQLQQRGINVHSCVNRVISILQNNLPKGVIPQDPILVPDGAIETFLQGGGLFERLANGFYQISPKQLAWMDNYLAQLCHNLQQSITEPMVFAPQTFRSRAAITK